MAEETTAQFLGRRERELIAQVAALKGQLAPKEAELEHSAAFPFCAGHAARSISVIVGRFVMIFPFVCRFECGLIFAALVIVEIETYFPFNTAEIAKLRSGLCPRNLFVLVGLDDPPVLAFFGIKFHLSLPHLTHTSLPILHGVLILQALQ